MCLIYIYNNSHQGGGGENKPFVEKKAKKKEPKGPFFFFHQSGLLCVNFSELPGLKWIGEEKRGVALNERKKK